MDSQDIDRLARLIFEYGESADSELMPASAILAFGSHDEHVSERAAELWNEGLASFIIFTGGLGRITKRLWQEPEAERFAHIAEEAGVPADAIDRVNDQGVALLQQLVQEDAEGRALAWWYRPADPVVGKDGGGWEPGDDGVSLAVAGLFVG